MYHRVFPAAGRHLAIQSGMYVHKDTFARHVRFLKENFSILPLDEVLRVRKGADRSDSRPFCILTFDDGWADFFECAFPILKAHRIPATVFLPTNFIGTNRWFWTDRLGFLLLQQEKLGSSTKILERWDDPLVKKILCSSGCLETRLEGAISRLKPYPQEEIERILRGIASCLGIDSSPPGRAFLTWEEIREMARSGLIGFGSHTATHSILTNVGKDGVRAELSKSKEKMLAEKIVSPDFIPFCYPNGNYNKDIARMVREAGYSLAVSTEFGWNGSGDDVFALKRIPIHSDMTSTQCMFLCRMAGIF